MSDPKIHDLIQSFRHLEEELKHLRTFVASHMPRSLRSRASPKDLTRENNPTREHVWATKVMEGISAISATLESLQTQLFTALGEHVAVSLRSYYVAGFKELLRPQDLSSPTTQPVDEIHVTSLEPRQLEMTSENMFPNATDRVATNITIDRASSHTTDTTTSSTDTATSSSDTATSSSDTATSFIDTAISSIDITIKDTETALDDITMDKGTRRDTTSPTDAAGDIAAFSPETFSLPAGESGDRLIPALAKFVRRAGFANKVSVAWPEVDLTSLQRTRLIAADSTSHLYKAGPTSEGFSQVYPSIKTEFQWPDFSHITTRPSSEEVEKFMEDIIRYPPDSPVSYYCGEASFPFEDALHSGETLSKCKAITIANSEYYHIGEKGSCTCFHCEDADFWSCNVTEAGYKVWIIIREDHTGKFEQFIRSRWQDGDCGQFVRHNNLLIAPSRLRKQEIEFDILCAGPGDMIITKPRQYHAVINFSACFARSINFTLPEEPLLPQDLTVCEDCGLYGLSPLYKIQKVISPNRALVESSKSTSAYKIRQKRKADKALPARDRKTSCTRSTAQNEMERRSQQINPLCDPRLPNTFDTLDSKVLKPAKAVQSLPAVLHFTSLVREWRQRHVDITISGTDGLQLIEQHAKYLTDTDSKSDLHKYRRMICQASIAQEIDQEKTYHRRASSKTINRIATMLNLSRVKLHRHLQIGRDWTAVLGSQRGLLAFILLDGNNLFGVKPQDYLDLKGEDLQAFHVLLKNEYVSAICSAGAILERIVLYNTDHTFAWEGSELDFSSLSAMDRGVTLSQVQGM